MELEDGEIMSESQSMEDGEIRSERIDRSGPETRGELAEHSEKLDLFFQNTDDNVLELQHSELFDHTENNIADSFQNKINNLNSNNREIEYNVPEHAGHQPGQVPENDVLEVEQLDRLESSNGDDILDEESTMDVPEITEERRRQLREMARKLAA